MLRGGLDPPLAVRGGLCSPVHDDGYGVSYMVSGERELFFHVSSKRSSAHTDSARFVKHLFDALGEMKAILSLALAPDSKASRP